MLKKLLDALPFLSADPSACRWVCLQEDLLRAPNTIDAYARGANGWFAFCHSVALTAAGRGVVSPKNIAFTRWLTHLQDGVLLDQQNCLMLHELWLQSGIGRHRLEGLSDDVRKTITVLFTAKRGDWCDFWSNEDISVWWNRLNSCAE
ncbi:TPA: DUF1281 domain-containing protein [Escherichia coli]|nr:DUF1281 domain-containing protein [Escherichia coli]EFB1318615.1 DUF1281 domain-containing protein [Escherichia coli]EFJ3290953.1 DUF1281 domain-containing protein [Escherichia coli]EFN7002060.1 DUF1281 domain-containing protein [Escherichia coli]EFO3763366.1 hypothetical protein [Escherichia coli]